MGSRLPHCWVRLQKDSLEEVEEGLGFCLIPVRTGGLRSVKMDRRSFRHYIINIFICAYTQTSTKKNMHHGRNIDYRVDNQTVGSNMIFKVVGACPLRMVSSDKL